MSILEFLMPMPQEDGFSAIKHGPYGWGKGLHVRGESRWGVIKPMIMATQLHMLLRGGGTGNFFRNKVR